MAEEADLGRAAAALVRLLSDPVLPGPRIAATNDQLQIRPSCGDERGVGRDHSLEVLAVISSADEQHCLVLCGLGSRRRSGLTTHPAGKGIAECHARDRDAVGLDAEPAGEFAAAVGGNRQEGPIRLQPLERGGVGEERVAFSEVAVGKLERDEVVHDGDRQDVRPVEQARGEERVVGQRREGEKHRRLVDPMMNKRRADLVAERSMLDGEGAEGRVDEAHHAAAGERAAADPAQQGCGVRAHAACCIRGVLKRAEVGEKEHDGGTASRGSPDRTCAGGRGSGAHRTQEPGLSSGDRASATVSRRTSFGAGGIAVASNVRTSASKSRGIGGWGLNSRAWSVAARVDPRDRLRFVRRSSDRIRAASNCFMAVVEPLGWAMACRRRVSARRNGRSRRFSNRFNSAFNEPMLVTSCSEIAAGIPRPAPSRQWLFPDPVLWRSPEGWAAGARSARSRGLKTRCSRRRGQGHRRNHVSGEMGGGSGLSSPRACPAARRPAGRS
jgi:hypothetical protein